uniref:FERM domain-containing protein n=1 Tax=Anopheles farauti TaxID=69004 RepID=A0A182QHM9_9DIPT
MEQREFGLDRFVPASLIEGMKRKELRRLLGHFLKLNSQMTGSSTKMLTQLQAKIHYLDIISGLPSYGAKCFSTNQRDGVERVLLVSPRFGLSQIAGVRNTVPQPICNLEELIRVVVTRDDDVSNTVTVFITPDRVINFAMEDRDASEFAIVLAGYYRLMAGKELPLEQERDTQIEDIAPPYLSQHTVVSNGWSYLPSEKPTHSIAFLMPPPYHSTGFRSATGSISSSSRSDECDRNANSARISNRNARPSLQEYDFEANGKLSKDGTMGAPGGAKIGGVPMAISEARNEEVLRRVAEMQKMVESSERYLNEHGDYGHEFDVKPGGKLNFWRETSVDVDESDCESLNSSKQSSNEDGPGVLKHSDSLTLLTETINQGLDGIAKGLSSIYTAPFSEMNGKLEPGSAQNTPKTQRKVSGLSQILSDLQALGNDLSQSERRDMSLKDYLRQLKEASSATELGTDGADLATKKLADLYGYELLGDDAIIETDPDIIDLRSIPPPQTPDELDNLNVLSVPPSGFDDGTGANKPAASGGTNGAATDAATATGTGDLEEFLKQIDRAFNHHHHRPTDPDSPEKATPAQPAAAAAGHQRSHSDCPPVCLKNPPADSRAQLTLLCSPQLARKTSLPTAVSPAVTFSNPGSPILANKNGHVLNVDTLMAKTDVAMAGLLVKLDQVAAACSAAQTAGGGTAIDEDRFQQARDELTDQALQLVTASKHLVVSMSDANLAHLPEHLTACLSALRRITELAQDLTRTTSAPLQTRNIVLKIHDVASSFRELACVKVGPGGAGQLALNAECLANVLATLLRSLRVFSP